MPEESTPTTATPDAPPIQGVDESATLKSEIEALQLTLTGRDTLIDELKNASDALTLRFTAVVTENEAIKHANTQGTIENERLTARVDQLAGELAQRIQASAGTIDADTTKLAAAIVVLTEANAKLERVVMIYANDNSLISNIYREAIGNMRTRLSLSPASEGYDYHATTAARVELAKSSAGAENIGAVIGAVAKFVSVLIV